jgi:hypothetical protein
MGLIILIIFLKISWKGANHISEMRSSNNGLHYYFVMNKTSSDKSQDLVKSIQSGSMLLEDYICDSKIIHVPVTIFYLAFNPTKESEGFYNCIFNGTNNYVQKSLYLTVL